MNLESKIEEVGSTAKSHLDSLAKSRVGLLSAVCLPE